MSAWWFDHESTEYLMKARMSDFEGTNILMNARKCGHERTDFWKTRESERTNFLMRSSAIQSVLVQTKKSICELAGIHWRRRNQRIPWVKNPNVYSLFYVRPINLIPLDKEFFLPYFWGAKLKVFTHQSEEKFETLRKLIFFWKLIQDSWYKHKQNNITSYTEVDSKHRRLSEITQKTSKRRRTKKREAAKKARDKRVEWEPSESARERGEGARDCKKRLNAQKRNYINSQ